MKIWKISDIFELKNIGYISLTYVMDIYRANPGFVPCTGDKVLVRCGAVCNTGNYSGRG